MKSLSSDMYAWLATEAERLVEIDESFPGSVWVNRQLDNLFWFASVDRMKGDAVHRDAIPINGGNGFCFGFAPHTRAAHRAYLTGQCKKVRRDHVVPRKVLRKLVREVKTADAIASILQNYAFVAIIHKDEHDAFSKPLKSSMPGDWEPFPPTGRKAWARYDETKIEGRTMFDMIVRAEEGSTLHACCGGDVRS